MRHSVFQMTAHRPSETGFSNRGKMREIGQHTGSLAGTNDVRTD